MKTQTARLASVNDMLQEDNYTWGDSALSLHARSISPVDLRLHGDDSVKAIDIAKMANIGPTTEVVSIDRDGDAFTIKVKAVVAFADRSRLAVDLLVKGVVEVRSDIQKRWPRYERISVETLRTA